MKYAIVVVSPTGYTHSAAFAEVAESLRWGLDELGHDVVISEVPMKGRRSIILGANLLEFVRWIPPGDSIIYNLEQIDVRSPWLTDRFMSVLRAGFEVWDYDPANADRYERIGCPRPAKIIPIGYAPTLCRIVSMEPKDIDVLFYGSMNDRRLTILSELGRRGVKAVAAFDIYGRERDALIARSKIVLNVHFYESKVFEIVRVSYLLMNEVCVVSETPIDSSLAGGVAFATYDRLVNCCIELLADENLRNKIATNGAIIMSERRIDRILAEALAEKPPSSPKKGAGTLGSQGETGGSAGVSEPPAAAELARALRVYDVSHPLLDRCPREWFE